MEKDKQLSIIIVTYNDAKHLKRCTDSIYRKIADSLSWEIIIVNNDERQDVYQFPLNFSKIKIVNHKKNVGFGSGMNLGAKAAEGKFLLILNPDTEIITDNITKVLEEFSKNDKIGIIGGGIIDRKDKKQEWSAGQEVSLYDLIRNNLGVSRSKFIWNSSQKIQCDWVAGTTLFVRSDLFRKLGGFDENFFMYFEDMDLCKRARKEGKKIIFFPEFKVFHGSGESYVSQAPNLQKKHYYDSMEKYFKKHCSTCGYLAVKWGRKLLTK